MSLYSFEEICEGCLYAHWHIACSDCYESSPRFCHCELHAEEEVNHMCNGCYYKRIEEVRNES
jgi:hypothetical protein